MKYSYIKYIYVTLFLSRFYQDCSFGKRTFKDILVLTDIQSVVLVIPRDEPNY